MSKFMKTCQRMRFILDSHCQQTRPSHPPRLLDPLLHVLGHPLQHRTGADYEYQGRPRPRLGAQLDPQAGFYWSGAVLCLLRLVRPAFEPCYVEGESACMDEQNRHLCCYHWDVFHRCQGRVELLVSARSSRGRAIANDIPASSVCSLVSSLRGCGPACRTT